ncbi:RrF2 family transcriptional regulator [Lewinella cohaerens]|uniref:RrF2 family transcriptional regulator n=1 Tax=Lewinella cohaerens TaxID=70995 RepID=UPI000374F345|nr:Rrf2 family transcriptional regulator [Lewinella cohaerens]
MFSKACEYGIRATIHLARLSEKDQRSSLKEVAEAIDSPVAFTGKILQSLARNGIILSIKGPTGGYEISKSKLSIITLSEIVDAIDGGDIYRGCGLGLKNCNESKPCPMHFQFKAIRDDLKQMLEETTVQDLANELHSGLAFLKR